MRQQLRVLIQYMHRWKLHELRLDKEDYQPLQKVGGVERTLTMRNKQLQVLALQATAAERELPSARLGIQGHSRILWS